MSAVIGTDLKLAADFLKQGKLVSIPTETVYGLAANAFNTEAVLSVFKAKDRPQFDPLIVHTHHIDEVKKFAIIPNELLSIAENLWPGPLTLLVPKKEIINPIITAGSDLVAIRIPNHALTLELLKTLPFPLVAPSANPFGYVSPTTAQHVYNNLADKIDYILDGGACQMGIESTIIGFNDGHIVVNRLGSISNEKIAELTNLTIIQKTQNNSNPAAPGMLDKHYSPRVKLKIVDGFSKINTVQPYALIHFGMINQNAQYSLQLSANRDIDDAAKNLFSILRELDTLPITEAYIQLLPENGLGKAINDRLKRASQD